MASRTGAKVSIRIPSVGPFGAGNVKKHKKKKKSKARKEKSDSGSCFVRKRKAHDCEDDEKKNQATVKVPRIFSEKENDDNGESSQVEVDTVEEGVSNETMRKHANDDEAFEEALLQAVAGGGDDDDDGCGNILMAMHSLQQKGCAIDYSVVEDEGETGTVETAPLVLKSMVHATLSSTSASASTVASAMSSTVAAEQIEELAQRNVLRCFVLTLDQENDEDDAGIALMERHHYERILRGMAAAHDASTSRLAAQTTPNLFSTTTISMVVKAADVVEWLIQTVLPRCPNVSVNRHQLEQLHPTGPLDKYIDSLAALGVLRPKRLSSSSSSSRRLLDSAQGTDLVWYWSLPSMGSLCRTILAGRRRVLQRLQHLARQVSSTGGGSGLQRSVLERRPAVTATSEESPHAVRVSVPAGFVVRDLLARQSIQLYYSPSGEAYVRMLPQRGQKNRL